MESSAEQHVFENGRRYHGFRSGKYNFPNDEGETQREVIKHNATRLLHEDRLHSTQFEVAPQKVLDLGTGTGIWAIEFADENPSSQVIAVDLSPIQPKTVPTNLHFQIEDIEDTWTFKSASFDFIHCRFMSSAIKDWPQLLQQAKTALSPGGKIELVDFDIEYTSDDGSVKDDNKLLQFVSDLRRAGPKLGINLSACKEYATMLEDAGYTNIKTEILKLPFGPWPQDRRLKEVGLLHQEQFSRAIQGIAYGMYGRGMKWSTEAIEEMLTSVRDDMNDGSIHGYWLVYFTTGEISTNPARLSPGPISKPLP